MCMQPVTLKSRPFLSPSQIADLRLAASKMTGAKRRAFEAEMTLKYCGGNPLLAEVVLGWGRQTVALGLAERRTGIICLGAQPAFSGRQRWEEQHPQAAQALRQLADAHAQQDPTFRTSLTYTRLTAQAALEALRDQGYSADHLPSPSTMAEALNRMGFRLRKVVKAKPQKKIKETDAIFDNIKKKEEQAVSSGTVKRLSMDCKATVKIGEWSRGGLTRGDTEASDHDMGCKEKYVPCGIVDEESGELTITFGSSYKTSDFIMDALEATWEAMDEHEKTHTSLLQIKIDNGPESSGRRTQYLNRMVQFADAINKPIQLLYYPPYHSKYNPIERCWGILELKWNGAKLIDVETMLGWAKKMTWKGMHPVVKLSRKVYEKGIALGKAAMRAIEARLKRHPELPKYDILINPAPTS